jgi:hypothetical protein
MMLCQINSASLHALPPTAMPVQDRKMSLDTVCREEAVYSAKLGGLSKGHDRTGTPVREFLFCENHSQLITQVDVELMEDGWGTAFVEKSHRLAGY